MVPLKTLVLKPSLNCYCRIWSKVPWILPKTCNTSKMTSGKWRLLYLKDITHRQAGVSMSLVHAHYIHTLLKVIHSFTFIGKVWVLPFGAANCCILFYPIISQVLYFQEILQKFHFQGSLEEDYLKIQQFCKNLWRRRNITTGPWNLA